MLVPILATGQGIRMGPDFLPHDVGNVWRYDVSDEDGNQVGVLEFEIREFAIVNGVSFYVFSQFPLAPGLQPNREVGIRYDQDQRQFVWFDGDDQVDLFPSLGASAEVIATDDNGLPLRALFQFGEMVLSLERGVGIVQAGIQTADGPRVANLVGARVGGSVIGAAQPESRLPASGPEALTVAEPIDNIATVEEVRPELTVVATPVRDGHRFTLTVRNPSGQLLPFDFNTSQSFDFVVVDSTRREEVWRWAERQFFSQVVRSQAIRAGGEWSFEGEWNHRDSDLNEVEAGTYEVFGVLASETPIESESIRFEVVP